MDCIQKEAILNTLFITAERSDAFIAQFSFFIQISKLKVDTKRYQVLLCTKL